MKLCIALVLIAAVVASNTHTVTKLKSKTNPGGFLPDNAPCCEKRIQECKNCIETGNYGCERDLPYCETERGGYEGRKADCEKNHCDEGKKILYVRVPQFTLTPNDETPEANTNGY